MSQPTELKEDVPDVIDDVFYTGNVTVQRSRTLEAGRNYLSFGVLSIPDGVEVTVADGVEWTHV